MFLLRLKTELRAKCSRCDVAIDDKEGEPVGSCRGDPQKSQKSRYKEFRKNL